MHADPISTDPWQARVRSAMRRHPDAEHRQRTFLGALALIGLGAFFLLQQVFSFGPQLIVLAMGIGFYVAYLNQRGRSDLIVPAGVFTGLGLGIALVSDNVTPGSLHGPLMLGSLAFGFAAIFFLGEARHRWSMWPAGVFAVLAGIVLTTSDPWRLDPTFAQFRMLWPLVLIAGGLWVLQRERWL
jgi:hypothetical protein